MKMKNVMLLLMLFAMLSLSAGEFITYRVNGNEYEGYYAAPSSSAPLIILVHDWDGLTDYEVRRSDMLVEKGYAVFAVDLFGKGNRPTETQAKVALTRSLYSDREKMRTLLEGGTAAAKRKHRRPSKEVAIGYCFGGAAVLEYARSGADFDAFVTFHGGLETPEGQSYENTKGKILVLHGTADSSVTMEQFAGLANELEAADVPHEMITYAGAPHAFTVFGSDRYRKDADMKSWDRFLEFLEEL